MKGKVLNPTAKELRFRSISNITPPQQKQPPKPRQPIIPEKETVRYAEISAVVPGSIAETSGIKKGDKILSINTKRIRDIIDYLFITSAPKVEIAVLRDMERMIFDLEKGDEPLGINFRNDIFDGIKHCTNKCVFCFEDQMPRGLREALYLKDDDYRLSLLSGNFITLSNLKEEDYRRIREYRISPVYVSVHATDPETRTFMMKNPAAGFIMRDMKRLIDMGTKLHAQIVLCPGINDGRILEKTLEDLGSLYPGLLSIGVVPVGLTKHRNSLPRLRWVDKSEAEEAIKLIENFQIKFFNRFGTRLVFAADEFYLKAEGGIPALDQYEDLPQLENGIGIIAQFFDEFEKALSSLKKKRGKKEKTAVITGASAADILAKMIEKLPEPIKSSIKIVPVENQFFGHSVTVAGLLTGRDIISALLNSEKFPRLLLPSVCLNDDGLFLDDLEPYDITRETGMKVEIIHSRGADFLKALTA